jgi:hypothetical protein
MKKILFLLIAMAATAVSLMAQTPQKIVPPSIAILMPEKVEMDDFGRKTSENLIKSIQNDSFLLKSKADFDGKDSIFIVYQLNMAESKTIAEYHLRSAAIMLEAMLDGATFNDTNEKVGKSKVVLIDQTLPQNLSAQHDCAVKNGVRYVLNPKKFTLKGSEKDLKQSMELVLYDTLLRKNIAVKTLNLNEYNYNFLMGGVNQTIKEPISIDYNTLSTKIQFDILDMIISNAVYNEKEVKGIKKQQKSNESKIDALYTAQPNPEIVALAMPLLEKAYEKDLKRQAKGNAWCIAKPLSENFYGTFFNQDKTKFIAFFAQNVMRENRYYTDNELSEATRTGPFLQGEYFVGIYKNKKWYIKNTSEFNYEVDKKKEYLALKKEEFVRKMKGILNEKGEINASFWQKEEFRTMKDKIKEVEEEIEKSRQEDKKYSRAKDIKGQKKMLQQYEAQLEALKTGKTIRQNPYEDNPAERMTDTTQLKEQIAYTKERILIKENDTDTSNPYSMTKYQEDKRTFYLDQYPEGDELVMKMQLDSIKKEIDDFEDALQDTSVKPLLQQLVQKRPDLYQNSDNWEVNKNRFSVSLTNKKHYFVTTTEVIGERKRGGVFKHHYLLLDIQTKKWYEWTYPETNKPSIPEKEQWRANAVFEQLAKWNDNYPMLNDPTFWANYVLKQDDGAYLYLKPIPD